MSTNVVGGIGQPRFLLCDVNYITNGEFEVDILGWSAVGGGTYQQLATDATDYGRYVNYVRYLSGGGTAGVQTDVDYSLSLEDTTWVATFAVAGDTYYMTPQMVVTGQVFQAADGITVTNSQQYLSAVFSLSGAVGTCAALQFKISSGKAFSLDHVEARPVEFDYTLPNPNRAYQQKWEKVLRSSYGLIDGEQKEFLVGWRFFAVLDFQYISKTNEVIRTRISEAAHVVFYPHQDENFFSNVVWDREFERRYAEEVFVGHVGAIPFKGVEVLRDIPKV